jgi:hypothetical protein
MGSVRNPPAGAWVLQGRLLPVAPQPLTKAVLPGADGCPDRSWQRLIVIFSPKPTLGATVWDLFYVGLTIVVFAVLLLILKGIESFER